jgi:hypothetical protein
VIDLPSEADIRAPADAIFDVIVDFRGQHRWLARSSSFHGTVDVSSDPVTLGTTYREPGPLGVRNGTVTQFERPTAVTFHQPMILSFGLGTVDVTLRYRLIPRREVTHVERVVTIAVPWPAKLIQPLIVRAFRTESARTLIALKAHFDQAP